MEYLVQRAIKKPQLNGHWDDPAWTHAAVAHIDNFHPASSEHHPRTQAKIIYDDERLYVIFRVQDRYVICTRTENQSLTSKDSCVEIYFEPVPGQGYFNFEMNCGGALLLFYVTDPTRCAVGIFKEKQILPHSLIDTIGIFHSMPRTIPVEIKEPIEWTVEFFVPYTLFKPYVGDVRPSRGQTWRGNFFKCSVESSHPHWASWNPIGQELNFHLPKHFGRFKFA